jgi:hypothetical protein
LENLARRHHFFSLGKFFGRESQMREGYFPPTKRKTSTGWKVAKTQIPL